MAILQKPGNCVPHASKSRDVERCFLTCEQLLQRHKRKVFCLVSWLVMKNGFITRLVGYLPGQSLSAAWKRNIHCLCLVWSWERDSGVLKQGETITGDNYRKQLRKFSEHCKLNSQNQIHLWKKFFLNICKSQMENETTKL